jgi:pilus assembly protein CpaE
VPLAVTLVGSSDRELQATLRGRGFRVTEVSAADVSTIHPPGSKGPDTFLIDVRGTSGLPREIVAVRRQFPAVGVVVLATALDPPAMLEAMRLGITEWVAEPWQTADLEAALRRVSRPTSPTSVNGRSVAIVGGKGGVGTTTLAVNLATSIRRASKEPVLLLDLHMAHGDTSVLLGVEPRFTVLDALENIQRLDEMYFRGLITPTKAGPDLLAAANRPVMASMDVLRVRALVEFVTTVYPWVVIDCPRSDPAVIDALDQVTSVVVVANQEVTTLLGASRLAAILRQRCGQGRVKLAISRYDAQSEIERKDVERVLGGSVNYTLPSDYRVAVTALNKGEPLVISGSSRLASAIDEVGRDLAGIPAPPRDAVRPGLFSRLGGRR